MTTGASGKHATYELPAARPVTAEDMAKRDTSNGYAFCCPLVGMYPCEQLKRGCYCHELHLINEHDRERRADAYCRAVFADNVKFGGMP